MRLDHILQRIEIINQLPFYANELLVRILPWKILTSISDIILINQFVSDCLLLCIWPPKPMVRLLALGWKTESF